MPRVTLSIHTFLLCSLISFDATASTIAKIITLDNPAIEVLHQQKKVQYMKRGIKTHKKIIQRTAAKDRNLLSELDSINRQLKTIRGTRDELRDTIKKQESKLKSNQQELEKLLAEKLALEEKMQSRLAAYYKMGDIGVLNVVFSNAALGDYLSFKEYFQHVVNHDQQLNENYRAKIDELSSTRDKLKKGKESLLSAERQVIIQEGNLIATKKNRKQLLADIRSEKTLYLKALQEIEEAAEQLTTTIEQLKRETEKKRAETQARQEKESREIVELTKVGKSPVGTGKKGMSKQADKSSGKSFHAHKGKLDPPARGLVVTNFGKNKTGKFGVTTYENGIDIKIAPGTKIKAVYDGTVVYTGTLRGYGKIIIIDHGDQYYSLISRVSKLFKKKNDVVHKGEVIAVMSDESGLLNDGLHFEIRHGSLPINPLQWLNMAKLYVPQKNNRS